MRAIFSLLLLAPFAWAGDLEIVGATKVPLYDLVRLKAKGAPPGAVYFWSVTPRLKPTQAKRGKGCLDFCAAPGKYAVSLRAVWNKGKTAEEGLDGEEVEVEVTVGPGLPDPKPLPPEPGPGPGPKPPDPLPALKQLWVVVIEETADAAETRGSLFRDKALADRMKAKGHKFRVADQDVKTADGRAPADVAPWIERAKRAGLPRLFLIDQDGNALHEGPVPATASEILTAITKAGG